MAADFPTVLVVDFGAQYAQLIARRVREADVYSEVVPHTLSAEEILARNPAALILSGGPSSVYSEDAPRLDPALLEAGVPVLGLCYGFQSIAQALGGTVARTGSREYGSTRLEAIDSTCTLFAGQDVDQVVWMSHGDAVTDAPEGFAVTASTPGAPVAAFEDPQRRIFGVQWHPEVGHSQYGQRVIERFLREGAGLDRSWTTANVIEEQVALIREQIGQHRAICGLSGGVDSAVAAALVQRAVGDQLTCVYVNHGLMRQDESEEIEKAFGKATGGARLVMVDAEDVFLEALAGVTDPETKRKIIGEKFIRTFEKAQADIVAESRNDPNAQDVKFLVQGTLYPDVVESGGGEGTANIKSHHNVGGLPEDIEFELCEPLRALFKDEVRAVGAQLGLPEEIVQRQPFPGPGLGIRIIGEVTKERLDLLRQADAIVRAELTSAGLDREIWQCPVVLLADVRSVGVQGDGRTYGHPVVLRPVTSEDAMTADWAKVPYDVLSRISNRITNEVDGINRVVLDVTSKPPGTIEWE
ncbi:glutamine-hydrolyzing GMP synthase [Micrococcus terreus]|uniref:glutamine-hydrolyzing GMP synthase n=1 Tax=Micrococcus terreus TaxID=574650 RepID=UPI003D7656CC